MFDLNRAIAEWRQRMAANGIKSTDVLDELESHLREDFERFARSEPDAELAFEAAVNNIGMAGGLKSEFAKIGGPILATYRVKQALWRLAGIPEPVLAGNMNLPAPDVEPGWCTYMRAAIFAMPAGVIWMLFVVLAFPKLNEILRRAGVDAPAFQFASWFSHYGATLCVLLVAAVGFLEWRIARWPRYRRAALGLLVFLLNSLVLVMFAVLGILAIVAAARLASVSR